MAVQEDVLGAAARKVLADKTRQWRQLVFEEALAVQGRNPDVRRAALTAPADHVEAGERLVMLLAIGMNPAAIRECIAWCEFVETELGDPVSPVDYNRRVDGDSMGRSAEVDRLALDEELEMLRAEVVELRASVNRLAQARRPDGEASPPPPEVA